VLEKLNLGKQGADLCSSPVTQMFVAAYFDERDAGGGPAWRAYVERLKDLYRRRRDVMFEALAEHFGEQARWTTPQGGLFIWATLDDRIDTTDLLALARKTEGVAFVPGRAAYMDGRSGSSSMRLNFAGVPDDDIREGVRRIGRTVREQLGLLGSFTGSPASAAARARPKSGRQSDAEPAPPGEASAPLADVVALPRRGEAPAARRRRDR
jgi:2-aminoadipate transaminase